VRFGPFYPAPRVRLTSKYGEADFVGDDDLEHVLKLVSHFRLKHWRVRKTADEKHELDPCSVTCALTSRRACNTK